MLSENPVFHDRLKHINIGYRFIWDCVHRGAMRLDYDEMGLRQNPFLAKREC